ncbi:phage tail assembly protein T [Pantoea phytobeneficialis]|uniref:Phage tail assembly protein T n=1 Tax=Pantoea phytobeneficialis TaxID=2052056 RepID=A0AAP9H4M2_9GAMM|nr:phage tail assembly protein T [Pantoea phytobeneficialis]MDO6406256.1 phage tail assembly protein T [Pantoea phytobeneficialis]QGR06249.1 phage tail assembly protein T [Pantoea phytobeneficialis]
MRLAREFGRPDWRAMLSGMTSTELREWSQFYRDHYFNDHLLDAHFASLSHLVISLMCKNDMTPASFSLLHPDKKDVEPSDEQLMLLAEGISGGVRYGPVSG